MRLNARPSVVQHDSPTKTLAPHKCEFFLHMIEQPVALVKLSPPAVSLAPTFSKMNRLTNKAAVRTITVTACPITTHFIVRRFLTSRELAQSNKVQAS